MVWLQRMDEDARETQMPEEWRGVVPTEVFLDEARRIVESGEEEGIILRVMGGVGIRLHTLDCEEMGLRLGRLGQGGQEFTDLDFMSYKQFRKRMPDYLGDLGYRKRRATLSSAASERQIYFHEHGWFFLDVFYDKLLVANHRLDFRGRLEIDPLTLGPTDLLLEKLQIVHLAEKDFKDILLLLYGHELAEKDERDALNSAHIAALLAKDWGFWYTVTTNLKGIQELVPRTEALTSDEAQVILARTESLLSRIEAEPKSLGWKARSKVGARKRWYEPVETEETVGDFGIWRLMAEEKNK
jgi:hypothetical protein